MPISINPIGIVHSPFEGPEGMPIQAAFSDAVGTLEIYAEYVDGLRDIAGFDYLILLYHSHLANKESLRVTPFLDDEPRGVFATRAPTRPNRIGLSVVRLLKVTGNVLEIGNLDIVSGTPVIDIKPYVPAFDSRTGCRVGWLAGKLDRAATVHADDRMRRAERRSVVNPPLELSMKISARNQFSGTVKQIVRGPVSAEITVSVTPGIDVVAVISTTSADNLGLAVGKPAQVLIKASSVLVGVD